MIDGRIKPKILTPLNIERIAVYKETKSLTETAKRFGVTRQAVEQTVNKAINLGDKELRKIKEGRGDHSSQCCSVCGRSFKKLAYNAGKCPACYIYEKCRGGKRGIKRRFLFLPKNCLNCNALFVVDGKLIYRQPGDLCLKCYTRTDVWKNYQRKSRNKPEVRAKRLAHARKFYHDHRGEVLEYQKQWRKTHRRVDKSATSRI